MKLVLLLYVTVTVIGCTYGHPGAHAGNFMASSPCFSFQGQNIIWPAGGGGLKGMSCPWNCFNHPFFSGGGGMSGFPGMPAPPKPCCKPCGEPIEASSPSSAEPDHPPAPVTAVNVAPIVTASAPVAIPEPVLADQHKALEIPALPAKLSTPEVITAPTTTDHPIQEASASSTVDHASSALAASTSPVTSAPTNVISTPVGIAESSNVLPHSDAVGAPSVVPPITASADVLAPAVISGQEASASVATSSPTVISSTPPHTPAQEIVAASSNEILTVTTPPAEIRGPAHPDPSPIAAAVPAVSAETNVPAVITPSVNHDIHPSAVSHETVAPTLTPVTPAHVLSTEISTLNPAVKPVEEASASQPDHGIAHPAATHAAIASINPVIPAPVTTTVVSEPTLVAHKEEASASNQSGGDSPAAASTPVPTFPPISDTCNLTCPFPSLINPLPCPIPYPDISGLSFPPFIDACNFTDLTSSLKAPVIDNCNISCNFSDHGPYICPGSWNTCNYPGLVPLYDDCTFRPYEHGVGCSPIHPSPFINPHCAYDDAVHHHCPISYPLYGDFPGCDCKSFSHIPSLNISDLGGCNFTEIEQKPLIQNFPIYNQHVCDDVKPASNVPIVHHTDHIPVDEPCANHLPVCHQYIRPIVGSSIPHVPFMDAHVRENIPAYDNLACGSHGVHYDGLPTGGSFDESHSFHPDQLSAENPANCPISIPETASNFVPALNYPGSHEDTPSCNQGQAGFVAGCGQSFEPGCSIPNAPELEQTIENFRKNLYLSPSAKHVCPHEEASSPGVPEEFAVNRGEDLAPLGRDIQPGECVGPCRNFADEGSAAPGDYYPPGTGPDGPIQEDQPGPASPPLVNTIPFPQENVEVSASDGSAGYTRHPDYCE